MMSILEGYDMNKHNVLNTHRTVEAFKHAYAQRTYYGDPEHNAAVWNNVHNFTSKEHAAHVRSLIMNNQTFSTEHYGPVYSPSPSYGTTHISVIGPDNDAASMTLTINMSFGSKVVCERTGVMFNNQMDDFSVAGRMNDGAQKGLPPSPYNLVEPGKRPQSSTCPMILEQDGRLLLVIGGAGGSQIPTAVYQTYQNLLEYIDSIDDESGPMRQSVYESVQRPRLHHQLFPNVITVEHEYDSHIVNGLKSKGHDIQVLGNGVTGSTVSAAMKGADGTLHASSDERKGGIAAGY